MIGERRATEMPRKERIGSKQRRYVDQLYRKARGSSEASFASQDAESSVDVDEAAEVPRSRSSSVIRASVSVAASSAVESSRGSLRQRLAGGGSLRVRSVPLSDDAVVGRRLRLRTDYAMADGGEVLVKRPRLAASSSRERAVVCTEDDRRWPAAPGSDDRDGESEFGDGVDVDVETAVARRPVLEYEAAVKEGSTAACTCCGTLQFRRQLKTVSRLWWISGANDSATTTCRPWSRYQIACLPVGPAIRP